MVDWLDMMERVGISGDMSNSNIPYNSINSLAIDSLGNTWIATGNYYDNSGAGLAVFKEGGILGFPAIEETLIAQPKVYPQPAKDRVTIEFKNLTTNDVVIDLIDISGRSIKTEQRTFDNRIELMWDPSNRPSGMYLLHIKSPDKSQVVKLQIK